MHDLITFFPPRLQVLQESVIKSFFTNQGAFTEKRSTKMRGTLTTVALLYGCKFAAELLCYIFSQIGPVTKCPSAD
jgi:hypothetical protein